MKSKIQFKKIDWLCVGFGYVPCRGSILINIYVFLPLKVSVLFKITGQKRRGQGALKPETTP